MEHVGHNMHQIHASVHTRNYYHKIQTQKTAVTAAARVDEEFHVYSMEWLPDRLHMFVDGVKYFTFDPHAYAPRPDWRDWPFDRRFYWILNVAVGGFWGGAEGIDETIWPQRMEVDYVRVYQSPQINALVNAQRKERTA